MLENKFDKQIRQAMDELKLKPSETVWTSVESRIREKKRRRRALIILPLLLGIALLGYFGQDYFTSNTPSGNTAGDAEKKLTTGVDNKPGSVTKETTNTYHEPNVVLESDQQNLINGGTNTETTTKIEDGKTTIGRKPIARNDPAGSAHKTETKMPVVVTETKATAATEKKNLDINNNSGKPESIAQMQTAGVNETRRESDLADTVSSKNPELKKPSITIDTISLKQKAEEKKVATTNKRGWFGVRVSSGISDISGNRTPFAGSPSREFNSPSSGPGTAFNGPSDNKPGFAFRAGIFGRKKLTDRTDVSVGVQYAYFSDKIRVGDRRDSLLNFTSGYLADQVSLSSYYRGLSQYDYTNRYHFIEVPVSYQVRLSKTEKHPIHWNAGLAITQLISTNALIYDTAFNGVYYNARDFFRKTHIHAFTGFTFTFRGKALEWSVEPELQFALTNLSRNSNRDGKFLQYTGVSASVILPKKK